jgi:hypothetical protein
VRGRRRGAAHSDLAGRARGGRAFRPHHLRTGHTDRRPVGPVDARPGLRVRRGFAARVAWLGEPRSGTLVAPAVPGRPPCVTRSAAPGGKDMAAPSTSRIGSSARPKRHLRDDHKPPVIGDLSVCRRPGCPLRQSLRVTQRLVRWATQTRARSPRPGPADHLLAPGLAPRKRLLPGLTASETCYTDLTCEDSRAATRLESRHHLCDVGSQRSFFKITTGL